MFPLGFFAVLRAFVGFCSSFCFCRFALWRWCWLAFASSASLVPRVFRGSAGLGVVGVVVPCRRFLPSVLLGSCSPFAPPWFAVARALCCGCGCGAVSPPPTHTTLTNNREVIKMQKIRVVMCPKCTLDTLPFRLWLGYIHKIYDYKSVSKAKLNELWLEYRCDMQEAGVEHQPAQIFGLWG